MDAKDDKMNEKYSGYMRRAEQINRDRVHKMLKTNKMNKTLALMLTTFVGSVYFYSMFAVKQEKFLDQIIDIDAEDNKQNNSVN